LDLTAYSALRSRLPLGREDPAGGAQGHLDDLALAVGDEPDAQSAAALEVKLIIAVRDQLDRSRAFLLEHQDMALKLDRHGLAGQLVLARETLEILRVGELLVGSLGEEDRLDARLQGYQDAIDVALEIRLELEFPIEINQRRVVGRLGGVEDLEMP